MCVRARACLCVCVSGRPAGLFGRSAIGHVRSDVGPDVQAIFQLHYLEELALRASSKGLKNSEGHIIATITTDRTWLFPFASRCQETASVRLAG